VIFDAVLPGCEQALDVGCGTGALTRRLRRLVPHVTGIDRDERSSRRSSGRRR
jgi:predicted TPR repeat methyltransferase